MSRHFSLSISETRDRSRARVTNIVVNEPSLLWRLSGTALVGSTSELAVERSRTVIRKIATAEGNALGTVCDLPG
jgi:hypothetical protein